MSFIYRVTLHGRPITKKNHPQKLWSGKIIPSKAWIKYENSVWKILWVWGLQTLGQPLDGSPIFKTPLWFEAHYFLPDLSRWPDLLGLEQGTADLFEKVGIIENDRRIQSWDGSRLHGTPDKLNPKVEITIRPFTEIS